MYIETQKGDLLAQDAIEIVRKPELPYVTISEMPEYHQRNPHSYAVEIHTYSGADVEVYASKGIYEVTLCFEILREYLTKEKFPHYDSKDTSVLSVRYIGNAIGDLLEDFVDAITPDDSVEKIIRWGESVNNIFGDFPHDLNACSVSHLSWKLAVQERLIMSEPLYVFKFTEHGIIVPVEKDDSEPETEHELQESRILEMMENLKATGTYEGWSQDQLRDRAIEILQDDIPF